jgi:ferric-dicitrate binding protein FerR (iron transport regulator)
VNDTRRPPDAAAKGPAERELDAALVEARRRLPDDVTLRRMWARLAGNLPEEIVEDAPFAAADAAADAARDAAMRSARARRWFWFAGGVGTTAALAVAFVTWVAPRRAPVVAARTPVTETRVVPAAEGTLRTGDGEQLHLRLPGGTEARLESKTVMRVDRGGRPSVEGGAVAFAVPHQPAGHSYVVLAGPYRVIVLGTKFRLRQDDTHRVYVDVQEGNVEVWGRERLAHLAPGETWASPAPAPLPPLYGPPASLAALVQPHKRTVALATPSRVDALGENESTEDATSRAQAALAGGDAGRALSIYRALALRGGPAAENAAYEVGKVLRDRLGQPVGAVAAWRRYRADHPNGVLRVETDVSIIETLVHAGDTSGALAEANDFVRNHPDSERRAEIARIAGDLYRTRSDWKRAVAAYQLALSSPLVRDAAEPATFHRAECLVRLGDPSGVEAARAYLRKWPSGRFHAEAERLLESGDGEGAERL